MSRAKKSVQTGISLKESSVSELNGTAWRKDGGQRGGRTLATLERHRELWGAGHIQLGADVEADGWTYQKQG